MAEMREEAGNRRGIQLESIGYVFGIVMVLFGLFTFIIPSLFGIPSNYEDMLLLSLGIVCIAIGGAIIILGYLSVLFWIVVER